MGPFFQVLAMAESTAPRSVQVFGKKKTATAVASCKAGRGLVKVNGVPLDLLRPEILRTKVMEPFYILGDNVFNQVDIRIRVRGGGSTSQVYAIRQAIAKAIVAYYQKCTYNHALLRYLTLLTSFCVFRR